MALRTPLFYRKVTHDPHAQGPDHEGCGVVDHGHEMHKLLEALSECSETLKNYCCPYCAEMPMHTYDRCLGYQSCLANAKLEAVLANVEGEK